MAETITYCRVCDPHCGLVASVENGRLVDVRPDKEHPYPQRFIYTKARGMAEVINDPDRVVTLLRRTGGPGEFEPVSWDEALTNIATRLRAIVRRDGPEAFASYLGNPPAHNMASAL